MPAKRFSWLVPRYSIANLLMLMVVIGIALAWYDQRRKIGEQATVLERQRLEILRLNLVGIIASSDTDGEKFRRLNAFIRIGDQNADVEKIADYGNQLSSDVRACQIGRLVVLFEGEHVRDFGYTSNRGSYSTDGFRSVVPANLRNP